MNLKYFGKVDSNGTLILFDRKGMIKDLLSFADSFVSINITLAGKRSNKQNAYYHAGVIPIVRDALKSLGMELSHEQTHDLLKFKFLVIEYVTHDGEIIKSIGSTRRLSKIEFNEYILRIDEWSNEYLGVRIPEPNEQLTI